MTIDGQRVGAGAVLPVAAGQRLDVGLVGGGLRTYLAVAGGFSGPEVFESCASDSLCGLGPGPLRTGDALSAGPLTPPLGDHVRPAPGEARSADGRRVLRVVGGPHREFFVDGAFDALGSRRFVVAAQSNRIGVRLAPEGAPGSVAPQASGGC